MLTLLMFGKAKCHQGKHPDSQRKHIAGCRLQSSESACYIKRNTMKKIGLRTELWGTPEGMEPARL